MKQLALIFALGLSFSFTSHADAPVSNIVGVWALTHSEDPMPDGSVVPYCTGEHGTIIYTAEGYVSVALNCDAVGHGTEPADKSGRKFFYTGRYHVDGDIISHVMENASDLNLIGSTFTRKYSINGSELSLAGENQGQVFRAYWKKVK